MSPTPPRRHQTTSQDVDGRRSPREISAFFRDRMPVAREWSYFDHAAVGPLPSAAADIARVFLDEAVGSGDVAWPQWAARVEETRRLFAEMIGAPPANLCLVPNTTFGINLVVEAFPWQAGDSVIVPANEFSSNLLPWRLLADRGVDVREVPLGTFAPVEIDDLMRLCDSSTRLVAVSWIGYASGWRLDVDELIERCHAANIAVFLDAIQAVGLWPIDVRRTPVDFLVADGHKWLLGPEGAGGMYISDRQLDRMLPRQIGWHSVQAAGNFSTHNVRLKSTADRYEGGSPNMIGLQMLGASLSLLWDLQNRRHDPSLAEQTLELADLLADRLTAQGGRTDRATDRCRRSSIVSVEFPGHDPAQWRLKLQERKIACSVRHGRLRFAVHGYNNTDDVQRLIDSVEDFTRLSG